MHSGPFGRTPRGEGLERVRKRHEKRAGEEHTGDPDRRGTHTLSRLILFSLAPGPLGSHHFFCRRREKVAHTYTLHLILFSSASGREERELEGERDSQWSIGVHTILFLQCLLDEGFLQHD